MTPEIKLLPVVTNNRLGSRKVKTGCITCKIRRVKCDEFKPECKRCLHSGRRCDGYVQNIQSQQIVQQWLPQQRNTALVGMSPERLLSTFAGTKQEHRSFVFYRDCSSSVLAHTLDSNFWADFILQISHSEPIVRHALVAIGALSERLRPRTKDTFRRDDQDQGCNLRVALGSYNKAISLLMQRTRQEDSEWLAILSCILFICVEFLQENIDEAMLLLHQGCAMLHGQKTRTHAQADHRRCRSLQLLHESDVLRIFTRLTILSALCGRSTTLRLPDRRVKEFERVDSFSDFRGARATLYELMDSAHELRRKGVSYKWDLNADPTLLPILEAEQTSIQHSLENWRSSFMQLQVAPEQARPVAWIQAVSLLSMYYTTTKIWVATVLDRAQTSFDSHLEEFRHIVDAGELFVEVAKEERGQVLFTFEMGLIPPLYFTAGRCRDVLLRRQAISLMQRAPGKEGMWDRLRMTAIAKRIVELEEGCVYGERVDDVEGTCNTFPRESSRLQEVIVNQDCLGKERGHTTVEYTSKPDGLNGRWHILTEKLIL